MGKLGSGSWVLAAILPAVAGAPAWSQSVTRGPYLQRGSSREITVRWRTDVETESTVHYRTTRKNAVASGGGSKTREHEVRITGLEPATKYFYSIGTGSRVLEGGDSGHFFVTAPRAGTKQPTRVWIIGDSGTADERAESVRDAYLRFTGEQYTHLWLMLGDNAYRDGTDRQYQEAVFEMYPSLLRQTVLFPTRGNHERDQSPYYEIFTMPMRGESGGLASGSEAYYSFDYANIHFICLDSQGSDSRPGGAMASWLKRDLSATRQEWLVAYWHHPPYSKGSHNSDSEGSLEDMRERIVPILESGGVDLVFGGHSHCYERSYLIDGQYGKSAEYKKNPARFTKNGGSGRDSTPYRKPPGLIPHQGTVYTVAGSSGKASGGSFDHPVMFVSKRELGSVVLDFNGGRVDARFLRENGKIDDYFTIIKGRGLASTASSKVAGTVVTIQATDETAAEEGRDPAEFTVTRTGSTRRSLRVSYTVDGTARRGRDYRLYRSYVTIRPRQESAVIKIVPVDDRSEEEPETVVLKLKKRSNYELGEAQTATITIGDNDTRDSASEAGGRAEAAESQRERKRE